MKSTHPTKINSEDLKDGRKIELSPNQQNPGGAVPEDFEIYCEDSGKPAPSVSGQRENDGDSAKRSRTEFNTGYVRPVQMDEVPSPLSGGLKGKK